MTSSVDLVQVLWLVIAVCSSVLVLVLPNRATRRAVLIKGGAAVASGLVWAVVILAIVSKV